MTKIYGAVVALKNLKYNISVIFKLTEKIMIPTDVTGFQHDKQLHYQIQYIQVNVAHIYLCQTKSHATIYLE